MGSPKAYFKEILRSLDWGLEGTDSVLVRVRLERKLKRSPDDQQRFWAGLEEHLSDARNFRKFMMRAGGGNSQSNNALSQSGDSLCRVLLTMEMYQDKLAAMLLQKLPELQETQAESGSELDIDDSADAQLPKLILSQLRWLDTVFNSDKLTERLFEVLQVCPFSIQRELISALPEIIDTSSHLMAVERLVELMEEDGQLTVPVLDTLSHLNLPEATIKGLAEKLIERLGSARLEDLPVLVRFLLHSANKQTSSDLVHKVRLKLNLLGVSFGQEGDSGKKSKQEKVQEGPVLVVETIRQALQFKPELIKAFLKEIESLENPQLKLLDVWVLLLIFGNTQKSKEALDLFRKKVVKVVITVETCRRVIRTHLDVTESMVPSFLKVAEAFARNTHPAVRQVGAAIYLHCFQPVPDHFRRQEIVGQLITHIGSGIEAETNTGLGVLEQLVQDNAESVRPFIVYLKGLLDYVISFTHAQLRQTFTIFSVLAVKNRHYNSSSSSSSSRQVREHESDLDQYLQIVIRKQLCSACFAYQMVGIIGGVCLLTQIAPARPAREPGEEQLSSSQVEPGLPKHREEEGSLLLKTLKSNSQGDPRALAFLYDELAHSILAGRLHAAMLEWVREEITNSFEDLFLVDSHEGKVPSPQLPGTRLLADNWFNLDGENAGIAVQFLPLLVKDQRLLLVLCPMFRLLSAIERITAQGSLSNIDALLGCPLLLFRESALEDFAEHDYSTRRLLLSSLFYAANWCREVLSTFGAQSPPEMQGKVCFRLQQLLELESTLGSLMEKWPQLRVHDVLGLQDDAALPQAHVPAQKAPNKKPPKSQKQHDHSDSEEKKPKKAGKKSGAASAAASGEVLELLQPHLRPLDSGIFSILSCPLTTAQQLKLPAGEDGEPALKGALTATMLEFLLCELLGRTKAKLAKRKAFCFGGAGGQVARLPEAVQAMSNKAYLVSLVPICFELRKFLQEMLRLLDKSARQTEDDEEDAELGDQPDQATLLQCCVLCGDFVAQLLQCEALLEGGPAEGLAVAACLQALGGCKTMRGRPAQDQPKSKVPDSKREDGEDLGVGSEGTQEMQAALEEGCQAASDLIVSLLPACHVSFSLTCKMLAVLDLLANAAPNLLTRQSLNLKVSDVAGSVLVRAWEKQVKFTFRTLGAVVRIYVSAAAKPLERLEKLALRVLPGLDAEGEELGAPEDENKAFCATLSNKTAKFYYVPLFEQLVVLTQALTSPAAAARDERPGDSAALALKKWLRHAEVFMTLAQLSKEFPEALVLSCALRQGAKFLEYFIRQMGFFEKCFKDRQTLVTKIIKKMQAGTRALQVICTHGKRKKMSYTALVPQAKKMMESFIYKVKALCMANDVLQAFWQGPLKNRAIDGSELREEEPEDEEEEEEEEQEEVRGEEEEAEEAEEAEADAPSRKQQRKAASGAVSRRRKKVHEDADEATESEGEEEKSPQAEDKDEEAEQEMEEEEEQDEGRKQTSSARKTEGRRQSVPKARQKRRLVQIVAKGSSRKLKKKKSFDTG
eukprot:g12033.t1